LDIISLSPDLKIGIGGGGGGGGAGGTGGANGGIGSGGVWYCGSWFALSVSSLLSCCCTAKVWKCIRVCSTHSTTDSGNNCSTTVNCWGSRIFTSFKKITSITCTNKVSCGACISNDAFDNKIIVSVEYIGSFTSTTCFCSSNTQFVSGSKSTGCICDSKRTPCTCKH